MAHDDRSLTDLAAGLKQDAARLAGALYSNGLDSPDDLAPLHEFMERMDATADTLAAAGLGSARVGPRPEPHNLLELTTAMRDDSAKLAVGLRQAGLESPLALHGLESNVLGLDELAGQMYAHNPEIANQPVPQFTVASPNTKPLAGRHPGARLDTMDYAGRKLESRLRADRLNRHPDTSLHPVQHVASHMAERAYGAMGGEQPRSVGGTNLAELNRAAVSKRERKQYRAPKNYTEPTENYTEPVRKIYREPARS